MAPARPPITGTTHILPFDQLSPRDFERLCLSVIEREGYQRVQHFGDLGSEQGRDVIAWLASQENKRVVFQCKRVKRFTWADIEKELVGKGELTGKKIFDLPGDKRPHTLIFIVTCSVPADARDRAIQECEQRGILCDFWASTEFDMKVKKYPEIVREFFQLPTGPRPPLELPDRPLHFKDRQAEMEKLLRDLKPGVVVTLCGPGGIGKTSLAAEALWQLTDGVSPPDDFRDGVLFHSFYNQPQADLACEHIARSFGEEPRPTAALAAQRALAGRTALLVLDGAEAADDLASVLALRGRCCTLVTSRDRGDIVEDWQDLDPLGVADGAALLGDWGGRRAADEVSAKVISELVGGLPMAIRLAGQYLQANEVEAQDYLGWLQKSPLAALDQGVRKMESVSVLLGESLNAISQGAIEALGVVGLLALAPFERRAVAEALEVEEAEAGRRLGELARYGMLRRLDGDYQAAHALVHTYARTRVEPPDGGLARLGGYYTRLASREAEQGLAGYTCLDSNRAHILAVLDRLAGEERWETCIALARAIEDYLDVQGHWVERAQVCEIAVRAAQALHDRRDEGAWLGKLGRACYTLREVHRAIAYYEQALAIARETGDRRDEGIHLGNLGIAYKDLGDPRRAIEYHGGALAIAREIGDRRSEGVELSRLGLAYKDLGKVSRAIEYHEQALAIARETGDRRSEGWDLSSLGSAYSSLGQVERAIDYYEQALRISREIGYRRMEANALYKLGTACADLGKSRRAIEHYEQAVTIDREIGDRSGVGADLGNLGLAYAALGEKEKARESLREALAIYEAIESPYIDWVRRQLDELEEAEP